jgi:hypothetical protein
MTVADMHQRMSVREYMGWLAFFAAEDRERAKQAARLKRHGARRPRRR